MSESLNDKKNESFYECLICDFKCSYKSNYDTHLSTRKHKTMVINEEALQQPSDNTIIPSKEKMSNNTCKYCNKKYSHLSGLSRHKKTCITSNSMSSKNEDKPDYYSESHSDSVSDSDDVFEISQTDNIIIRKNPICNNNESQKHRKTIKDLTDENREMKAENREMKEKMNMMLQMMATNSKFQSEMLEIIKSSKIGIAVNGDHNTFNNTTSNNNSNNNTFNMNMFLNEKCKDAMNMKDFVNSIQLNITDLENVGRLGYVEGMSNILIDNLQKTDIYKRPVHCSDVKRETLYVKDNNQWEREGPDHVKMTNAVLAVEQKNVALVSEWAKANPRCMNSNTRENEKYFKLSKVVTDGEKDGNIDKVISKVAKKVRIEKDA